MSICKTHKIQVKITSYPVCPKCLSREFVGFLGGSSCKKYFCSECCIEYSVKNNSSAQIIFNGISE